MLHTFSHRPSTPLFDAEFAAPAALLSGSETESRGGWLTRGPRRGLH